MHFAPWSNGRTAAFEAVYLGSNPSGASMNKSERIINADVIRILAMLMIIVMHTFLSFTIRPDFFQTPIYFLLSPIAVVSNSGVLLFFILSGYLVVGKKRTIKENFRKTAIKLGIPFVFFQLGLNNLTQRIEYPDAQYLQTSN